MLHHAGSVRRPCLSILRAISIAPPTHTRTHAPRTAGRQSLYVKFDVQYKGSKAWQAAYAAAPQSACRLRGGQSRCSSESGDGVDRYARLVLATSPAAYSLLDTARWTGGCTLLAAVR